MLRREAAVYTHTVRMESLGGRARSNARAWRGRSAPARPPAREYHRQARISVGRSSTSAAALLCVSRTLASPGTHYSRALNPSTRRTRFRVFINEIPRALFGPDTTFYTTFGTYVVRSTEEAGFGLLNCLADST